LGGHGKTKCIDWVDTRVDTFNMVFEGLPPPCFRKKLCFRAFSVFRVGIIHAFCGVSGDASSGLKRLPVGLFGLSAAGENPENVRVAVFGAFGRLFEAYCADDECDGIDRLAW